MKYAYSREITIVIRETVRIEMAYDDLQSAERERNFFLSYGGNPSEVVPVSDDFKPYKARELSSC